MAAGGSIGQQIVGYGGKKKIVGNRIGGTNAVTALFASPGSTVTVINLNPDVKHFLNMDCAGATDVSMQLTRSNVERIDSSQAAWSAAVSPNPAHLTAASNFLGVVEEGHTAIKLTVVKTASSPADDPTLLASLGARAVLSIMDTQQPRDFNGNPVSAPYNGPVITGDEETPVFTSA